MQPFDTCGFSVGGELCYPLCSAVTHSVGNGRLTSWHSIPVRRTFQRDRVCRCVLQAPLLSGGCFGLRFPQSVNPCDRFPKSVQQFLTSYEVCPRSIRFRRRWSELFVPPIGVDCTVHEECVREIPHLGLICYGFNCGGYAKTLLATSLLFKH